MHSDTVLDQCGKCFWRILIDFVSGVGDDMQMGLRQECVQLFCGFEICTILFSTDDGHRTVYFGKLRAEIKHAHGMGQFDRVMFGKSAEYKWFRCICIETFQTRQNAGISKVVFCERKKLRAVYIGERRLVNDRLPVLCSLS